MERRTFLSSVSVLAAAGFLPSGKIFSTVGEKSVIKPKMLKPGDTVGIIAPATAVTDPDDLILAKEALDYFGLKYKFGKNLIKGTGYKSRSVAERLDDLHSMFADNEVSAVFCIRGGYGTHQLLGKIDYELIKNHPKILLGYSDITGLHLAVNKMTGLVTFHGPVLLSSFTTYTIEYFKKALFSDQPIGLVTNSSNKGTIHPVHPVRSIKPGKAEGKLIGGNLSLVSNLMGTPYEIETKGKILFLEDVGEEPFRIDRMLNQLKLAGKLKDAAGIVFGECKDCTSDRLQGSRVWDSSLGEVLDNIFADINVPVFTGLTIGHTSDQVTLPLGINSVMDAGLCTLNITESAVV